MSHCKKIEETAKERLGLLMKQMAKSQGSDTGTEIEQSDEMGRDDEQYPQQRGGNHNDGADLQLAYHGRETEDRSLPFFHSDTLIKEMLNTTPHLSATRADIAKYFAEKEDTKSRTEYIKSIFNNDYTELIVGDNIRVGYKTYQNVLHLWEGSYLKRTAQGYYDWSVIANYFAGMILTGELSDIMKPLPSVSQQITLMDLAEEEKTSLFSQEIIDYALQRGSGYEGGKYRIYEQFSKKLSTKENERFLSNEYGTGGASPILSGTGISEWHDGKGITLSRGDDKITLSWSKVAKRIGELILADRYLNEREKAHYPIYLAEAEKRRQKAEERRIAKEILEREPTVSEPSEDDKIQYSFSLGDTVYLGADKYEILSFDDNTIRLFDSSCPLINKSYRADFDRM